MFNDSASISLRGMEPHSRTLTFTVLSGEIVDTVIVLFGWFGYVCRNEIRIGDELKGLKSRQDKLN